MNQKFITIFLFISLFTFSANCKKSDTQEAEDSLIALVLAVDASKTKCSHGEKTFTYEGVKLSGSDEQNLIPFSFNRMNKDMVSAAIYAPGLQVGDSIELANIPATGVNFYTRSGDCNFPHPNRFKEVGYWDLPTGITASPTTGLPAGPSSGSTLTFTVTTAGDYSILVLDNNTTETSRVKGIKVSKK